MTGCAHAVHFSQNSYPKNVEPTSKIRGCVQCLFRSHYSGPLVEKYEPGKQMPGYCKALEPESRKALLSFFFVRSMDGNDKVVWNCYLKIPQCLWPKVSFFHLSSANFTKMLLPVCFLRVLCKAG